MFRPKNLHSEPLNLRSEIPLMWREASRGEKIMGILTQSNSDSAHTLKFLILYTSHVLRVLLNIQDR